MARLNSKRIIFLIILLALAAGSLAMFTGKPRVLAVNEVPIAFWAWRTQTPDSAELAKVFAATNAKTLFVRAGQFDLTGGAVHRIRPASGKIPAVTELHLVYNATRPFLRSFESLDTDATVKALAATFQADVSRARNDGTDVHGLQLDLDIPNRLLEKYAEVLRRLRGLLPPDTKLSITGLPAWIESDDLGLVLYQVDFWIPQFYGGNIPTLITDRIATSSASDVGRTISKVRLLKKPFYAGLAAYSYAILYDTEGRLVELRGDIDPMWAEKNPSLELVERKFFRGDARSSQVRYEYRARADLVLDGLIIRSGETLVFDLPTAASIRAAAAAVRKNAGVQLLGICMFRLPIAGDETALGVTEIANALADKQSKVATHVGIEALSDNRLRITGENIGSAATIVDKYAMTIDLDVPTGSSDGVFAVDGFSSYEVLCRLREGMLPRPCGRARANVVRLTSSSWKPGSRASIELGIKGSLTSVVAATITTRVDDGRVEREVQAVVIQKSEK